MRIDFTEGITSSGLDYKLMVLLLLQIILSNCSQEHHEEPCKFKWWIQKDLPIASNWSKVETSFQLLIDYLLHWKVKVQGTTNIKFFLLNWINPKNLSPEQQCHRQKIRESLEIKKAKMNKRRKVLNRDEGNLVKTKTWTSLFVKLIKEKTNTKTWCQTYKRF